MHTTPFSTLLDQLATELSALTPAVATDTTSRKRRPHTVRPGILDDKGLPLAWSEPTHDWAAYDSSDIHERTAEWEAQAVAAERPVIQHFVAKKRTLITATQREQANAALTVVMPGVRLSEHLRQSTAHKMLTDFVGLDAANRIMASA